MTDMNLSPEKLSELIGLVYDSAFEKDQWTSFLQKIGQMYPGVGAVAWGHDGNEMFPEYTGGASKPVFTGKLLLEMKVYDTLSVSEAAKMTPNGFVARSKIIFDETDFLNSELYKKYLQPAGLRHSLQLKVDHVGDRGAYLGFAIPEDKTLEEKYHDSLFELTKLLAPHAVRASQLARALTLAKRATEVFSGFLDGILLPMLVTNESGRYLFANAAGRRLLKRSDPMKLTNSGDLVLHGTDDTRALQRRILSIGKDQTANGLRVETESGAPLLLALTPFRPSMREASAIDRHLLEDEQLCAVFVGQSVNDELSTSLLEDVFDMTPREAAVCSRLIRGMSATEIADISNRALKTVRNQIQVIYEKVGVSSNVALIEALSVFRTVGSMFDHNEPLDQEERLLLD
jgi:DNA-binding CsgD family transcriptional regulator